MAPLSTSPNRNSEEILHNTLKIAAREICTIYKTRTPIVERLEIIRNTILAIMHKKNRIDHYLQGIVKRAIKRVQQELRKTVSEELILNHLLLHAEEMTQQAERPPTRKREAA